MRLWVASSCTNVVYLSKPSPPGTNAVLGYFYYNRLGEITAASPGGIPDHSASANQFVELLRYAHWFNLGTNGPLGILEVTRKRVSAGLLESFSETCPTCGGRGILLTHEI